MNNKKVIIYFLISILNFILINCQNNQPAVKCNCFVDSQSKGTITNKCGESVGNACSTIIDGITSCGEFDEITINIVPGLYNINSKGAFGSITNKTINILNSKGNGDQSVIIDLSNATDSFITIIPQSINDVSSISMNGLTFRNGHALYGSVLKNNGTSIINMNIVNCLFNNITINNGQSVSNGGGGTFAFISSNGYSNQNQISNISISQCTFSNSNMGKISSSGGGGVIYNSGLLIQFTIDQSTFSNNIGLSSGGIIYSTGGYLTMINTEINNSYSSAAFFLASTGTRSPAPFYFNNVTYSNGQGGVGFAIVTLSTSLFQNCKFQNNVNTSCIYLMQSSEATIENCLFDKNINLKGSQNISSAITCSESSLSIDQSIFSNNYAPIGGAINILGASLISNYIQISNSQFNNNSAQYGGSIADTHNLINLNNVEFNSNSASEQGSSLYCFGGDSIFKISSNSTFQVASGIKNNGIDCLSSCSVLNSDTNKSYGCNSYDNDDNNNNNGGLTTGQKVGIAIATIAIFGILVLLLIFILRKYKQSKQYKPIGI